MNKEVLLILGILEGRGWKPVEGHKAIIEANLDSHKLSTKPFLLSNSPKINTEITWEAEKQTVRSYKINRIPIKIECFSIDDNGKRKFLGYVVLPLTSAVEGVVADAKWYKLLGISSVHQTPPSLLLQLNLESMKKGDHHQFNGKSMNAVSKNGQNERVPPFNSNKMTRTLINNDGYPAPRMMVNGNKNNARFMATSNGNHVADEAMSEDDIESIDNDVEYEDEEDYLDDEEMSPDPSSCGDDELMDNAVNVFPDRDLGRSKENTGKVEGLGNESTRPNPQVSKNGSKSVENSNKDDSVFADDGFTTNEQLLQNRSGAREQLLKLSQNVYASSSKAVPSSSKPMYQSTTDILNSCLQPIQTKVNSSPNLKEDLKRIAPSNSPERTNNMSKSCQNFVHKLKSLKTSDFKTSKAISDANEMSRLKTNIANKPDSTLASILLSQKFNKHSSSMSHSRSKISEDNSLTPVLNPEGGFFSIGPQRAENIEEFVLSVTIFYAKNLRKLISGNSNLQETKKLRFRYQLLGFAIETDPFSDLDEPELAEKASAKIQSSHDSLAKYFTKEYVLPIHLKDGNSSIGLATIDISQLVEILTDSESNVKGVFEIQPVGADSSKTTTERLSTTTEPTETVRTSSKPIVAVSVSLSKTYNGNYLSKTLSSLRHNSGYISSQREPHSLQFRRDSNELVVSDSSDEEVEIQQRRIVTAKRRDKSSNLGFCSYCKRRVDSGLRLQGLVDDADVESEKKMLLHEAAYEIEQWKQQQKRVFLKEWSEKEKNLQEMIAMEWTSRVKMMEGEMKHRLEECDKLEQKLNGALLDVASKEEKLRSREKNAQKLENELATARKEQQVNSAPRPKSARPTQFEMLEKQLDFEKKRNLDLQKESNRLRDCLTESEQTVKAQTSEVVDLRKKLIQSDDVISAAETKKEYENKIESLQERKKYYKTQWLSAINDLHKFHSMHKRNIEQITDTRNQPDSSQSLKSPRSVTDSSVMMVGNQLRQLNDERTALLETGLYSSRHSIIRNIDRKIKELLE